MAKIVQTFTRPSVTLMIIQYQNLKLRDLDGIIE